MLFPNPETAVSALIGNLIRFVLALIVMVMVLYFIVAYELYAFENTRQNVHENTSFNQQDCVSRRIRSQNFESYYLRRAALENAASKRGYKTKPDWKSLAELDQEYQQVLPVDFFKGCGAQPSPPADLHFVTPPPPPPQGLP